MLRVSSKDGGFRLENLKRTLTWPKRHAKILVIKDRLL